MHQKIYDVTMTGLFRGGNARHDKLDPVMVIQKAISLHTGTECAPQLRSVKPNEKYGGRTMAFEISAESLNKVKQWALDHKATHFPLFTERLRFWTSPSSSKTTAFNKAF